MSLLEIITTVDHISRTTQTQKIVSGFSINEGIFTGWKATISVIWKIFENVKDEKRNDINSINSLPPLAPIIKTAPIVSMKKLKKTGPPHVLSPPENLDRLTSLVCQLVFSLLYC